MPRGPRKREPAVEIKEKPGEDHKRPPLEQLRSVVGVTVGIRPRTLSDRIAIAAQLTSLEELSVESALEAIAAELAEEGIETELTPEQIGGMTLIRLLSAVTFRPEEQQ